MPRLVRPLMDGSCLARVRWSSGYGSVAALYSVSECRERSARHAEFRVDLVPITGPRREVGLRSERGLRILLSVILPSSHAAPCHPGWPVTGLVLLSAGHHPVAFAGLEQGPDGSRQPRSKGKFRQLHRLLQQHLPQPVFSGALAAAGGDQPQRPRTRQAAKGAVAHPGDLARRLPAAARMGLWGQPDPGGQVTRRPDLRHVRYAGGPGARGDRPNPRVRSQAWSARGARPDPSGPLP